MPAPLLKFKLYVPPLRSGLVPRLRLLERLDEGLQAGHRLLLLSAPAGYGKTTLLSAWTAGLEYPVAWLSLDAEDDEPARFLVALIAALQTVEPRIGQDLLSLIEAPQPPPLQALMGSLIDDLAAISRSFVLVLDDYHVLTDAHIHRAIAFLLQRPPPQLHLVIATREDPPFPLSLERGRGQLTEIRQRDLQFSDQETAAFLSCSTNLDLDEAQAAALRQRTEGWVAGLQLARLVLSVPGIGGLDVDRLIAGLSGRHHLVLDYLAEEVLRRQPESVLDFLLQTSILERMCGPLCDALAGPARQPADAGLPSSQAMLEYLEHANLFVVPLDGERQWYRYHRLFGELLRAQLDLVYPDRISALHRRASLWYDSHAFLAEAVRHALAIPDFELAADVIERAAQKAATWSRLDGAMFLGWWNALPREVVRARPTLQILASRSLYVTGQKSFADRVLQETEQWLHEHPDSPGAREMLARIVIDRMSYAAVHGQVRRVIPFARQALAQVPEGDTYGRVRLVSLLGLACTRAGEVAEAERAFSQAVAAAGAAHVPFIAAPLLANLADVQIIQGRLHQARQTCEQGIVWGMVDGVPTFSAGFCRLCLARIEYEWDELQAAQEHAEQALQLVRQGGLTLGLSAVDATLALIAQALGNDRQARAAMEQGVQIAQSTDILRLALLAAAHRARIWLAQGRIDLAARWALDYRQVGATDYLREFEDLTLARVLLAQKDPAAVLALLRPLLDAAQDAGRTGTAIEALALQALALYALDDTAGALEVLGRALVWAEPEEYVRTFTDEGAPMARLLHEAARHAIAPSYVGRLLLTFSREPEAGAAAPGAAHPARIRENQALVEPLTEREIQVLQLLAARLTNSEIGERLFISLPTVKSHTRSLYGKLGVHGRTEAVARAGALGIL